MSDGTDGLDSSVADLVRPLGESHLDGFCAVPEGSGSSLAAAFACGSGVLYRRCETTWVCGVSPALSRITLFIP